VLILKRALLIGYYGYGNLGDEILMEESVDILRSLGFKKIDVLYPRPMNNKRFTPVKKMNPFYIILSILKSDVVFFGGGGILQDETSFRSFAYYSLIALTASLLGKKVIFLGNSFGPVRKKLSKNLLRIIARSKKVVFFPRDDVSQQYLSRLSPNVRAGTDLSIGYLKKFKDPSTSRERKEALIVPRKKRDWGKISEFLTRLGFKPRVLLADPLDMKYLENQSMDISFGLGISEISSSSLVISERFHPALIAAYFGIPFVSVGSKSSRFFRRYLPDYPGILDNPSDLDIMISSQRVLKERLEIKEMLEKDFEDMVESLKKLKI
jgi:polysaccharide pyruvyl transferase CsaB